MVKLFVLQLGINKNIHVVITEAQIRFLKAKLRVMQEELDRLSHECNKKVHMTRLVFQKHICLSSSKFALALP